MKNQNSAGNSIVRPAIVLTVMALVTAFCLALTNMVTEPIIAEQAERRELMSRQVVIPDAEDFAPKTGEIDGESFDYLEALDGSGEVIGYVFQNSTNGYGGPVTVMMGVDTDGEITGVEPLNLAETPGFGMNAQNPEFLEQFIGRSGEIASSKTAASDTEILGLSGATVTTGAFVSSVNQGMQQFGSITGQVIGGDPKAQVIAEAATFSDAVMGTVDGGEFTYWHAFDETGEVIGYVIQAGAEGYAFKNYGGALLNVLVGIDLDGVILGTAPFEIEETPGVGTRVEEEEFRSQFVGQSGELASFDGLAGATVSSNAYRDAVNLALQYFAGVEAPKDPKLATVPGAASLSEAMSGTLDGEEFTYYEALDSSGEAVGYIFENVADGYNKEQPFSVQVGVDTAGVVTGTKPIDVNETEGLGTQVEDAAFQDQFVGISGDASGVDSIAHATVSSSAYKEAVTKALAQFAIVEGGAE